MDDAARKRGSAATLRRAMGDWLRGLAAKVDGRWTLAIDIPGSADLDSAAMHQAVVRGLRVIRDGLQTELRLEQEEQALRLTYPELYR